MKNIVEIGLPCTPSKRISTELINAMEILVSWNGGLGGSSKYYYATSFDKNSNGAELIDGDKIAINPTFIVHAKDVIIAKQVIDRTPHANYIQNGYNSYIITDYFLIDFGYNPIFVDKYIHEYRNCKNIQSTQDFEKI